MLMALCVPIVQAQSIQESEKEHFSNFESYNRAVTLPTGKKLYYYAQNSPEWAKHWYDTKPNGFIVFGDGGCVASTLANTLINLAPKNQLSKLKQLSRESFLLDSKAVPLHLGHPKRKKFAIESSADFAAFLPLVLGQYASGNNLLSSNNYRSTAFYKPVFSLFHLQNYESKKFEEVEHVLADGGLIVSSSGGMNSPIARGGHFFVIADSDENYIYILDSLVRERYKLDKKRYMEIMEPGVVRVKKENLTKLHFNYFIAVEAAKNITSEK